MRIKQYKARPSFGGLALYLYGRMVSESSSMYEKMTCNTVLVWAQEQIIGVVS